MSKKNQVATITEAARSAGQRLSVWGAVEAEAKKRMLEASDAKVGKNFAEIHFFGGSIEGVIKAGDVVLKVQS